ncbi:WPP domain-interacting tail-anchored protein 1 [Platanthera guangdongensis]|uniref:WPP domain-interacting tail-anchored protein 1 n=1 Tax=Platanthera guangdongensis TaxID=2320717 RepID=A0ABR2LVN6_9ASPA
MVVDDGIVITSSLENLSSNGERIAGCTAREVLAQMELDLAYSSEKVLNLEILMMQVSDIARDYEILSQGHEELLTASIEKAFQFDILTEFLNSVAREMHSFMASLQLDIIHAQKKFTERDNHLEDFLKIEEKLHYAEVSLKNSQDIVADISKQSDKFEKFLAFWISTDRDLENGECSAMNSKWKLQIVDQQRQYLQSLEKSLAREMDLEKNLSESRYNEEELKIKLQFKEQDACYVEGFIELLMVKMFTAENSVELLLGNLKEFIGKLQNGQFSYSSSTTREWKGKDNMEKCFIKLPSEEDDPRISRTLSFVTNSFPAISDIDLRSNLKELEDKCLVASSDVSTLRETVNILEEQLRESETQLQLAKVRESRAESVDSPYTQLLKSNVELKDELGFLRSNGTEKTNLLERKLKESNMQFEHAKASFEATEEQRKMLSTSLNDMEHLIVDLKGRLSKAENRAESAEAKCTLLTDTNLELNEELSFLRGKLKNLDASLHHADMEKIAAVKDIGHRTRLIIELVKKLAFERERLQLQISVLTKGNQILSKKSMRSESNISVNREVNNNSADSGSVNSYNETLTESLPASFQKQVDGAISSPIYEMKLDPPTVSAEDFVPSIELVRTIDATQLNWKYIFMALIALLVSVLAVFFIPT